MPPTPAPYAADYYASLRHGQLRVMPPFSQPIFFQIDYASATFFIEVYIFFHFHIIFSFHCSPNIAIERFFVFVHYAYYHFAIFSFSPPAAELPAVFFAAGCFNACRADCWLFRRWLSPHIISPMPLSLSLMFRQMPSCASPIFRCCRRRYAGLIFDALLACLLFTLRYIAWLFII